MHFSLSKIGFLFILLSFTLCVDPYEFKIENDEPWLVVEGQISDQSFNECVIVPSDGRFFEVTLRWTSEVKNVRDQIIAGARVTLENDSNTKWNYSEISPGKYLLLDPEFKALKSVKYRLQIGLPNGENYQSSWEEMPDINPEKTGAISIQEIVKPVYKYVAGEKQIIDEVGINLVMDLPQNEHELPTYYKWEFTPIWIYTAPFASSTQPGYTCWITNDLYLNQYRLLKDNIGGYKQELTFIETIRNNRMYEEMSVLISQYSMSEDFFNFWSEMKSQMQNGGLFDAPPFNYKTNFECVNCNSKVSGYFGVVSERATRWYFDPQNLSYQIVNYNMGDCTVPFQDPGPECSDCRAYPKGASSNKKPLWWKQ